MVCDKVLCERWCVKEGGGGGGGGEEEEEQEPGGTDPKTGTPHNVVGKHIKKYVGMTNHHGHIRASLLATHRV